MAPQAPACLLVDDARFDAHHNPRGEHPERPERLVAAREGLFAAVPAPSLTRAQPTLATEAELATVHDAAYVSDVYARLSEGEGFLDEDTFFSAGTKDAALLAAGAGLTIGQELVTSATSRAIALMRPPGHHAEPKRAMGFCLFNTVALAAKRARACGAERVVIIDWDVHHGNGTQAAFYDDPNVLFISLHQWPLYPGTGASHEIGVGAGKGYTVNFALPAQSGIETYAAAFGHVVRIVQAYGPDLVLVSAGFDAHARDPLAQMSLEAEAYGAFTRALTGLRRNDGASVPLGLFLEGGYDLIGLKDSVRATATALLSPLSGSSPKGEATPAPLAETLVEQTLPQLKVPTEGQRAIDATLAALAPYWAHLRAST